MTKDKGNDLKAIVSTGRQRTRYGIRRSCEISHNSTGVGDKGEGG